jgi:glutathione S-transferase
MTAILNFLDARLLSQKSKSSRFFIGNQLTALDIYWATFAALLKPLGPEQCPMATGFRDFYSERDPTVMAALTSQLLAHRDFIYSDYLELPIVF